MDCNDRNIKGFVGYKYPIYACFFIVLKFYIFLKFIYNHIFENFNIECFNNI